VLKLKTDPNTQVITRSILPFTGLNNPRGVALDNQGNLYVVDSGNNRVLKLGKSFAAQ
jgi:DNA-binding beta-propeller fold protein YncE